MVKHLVKESKTVPPIEIEFKIEASVKKSFWSGQYISEKTFSGQSCVKLYYLEVELLELLSEGLSQNITQHL